MNDDMKDDQRAALLPADQSASPTNTEALPICSACRVNQATRMWSHVFGWDDLCEDCYAIRSNEVEAARNRKEARPDDSLVPVRETDARQCASSPQGEVSGVAQEFGDSSEVNGRIRPIGWMGGEYDRDDDDWGKLPLAHRIVALVSVIRAQNAPNWHTAAIHAVREELAEVGSGNQAANNHSDAPRRSAAKE